MMNKKYFISTLAVIVATTSSLMASFTKDVSNEIPEMSAVSTDGFAKLKDVAQYGEGDWSNVVGIARGISVQEAKTIASNNPEITFFFYTKGYQMVLGTGRHDGSCRVFHHGDTVFFSGEPWWGSANDLADGYMKQ